MDELENSSYDNSLSRPRISKSLLPAARRRAGGMAGGALPNVNGALPWGNTPGGRMVASTAGPAAQPVAATPVARLAAPAPTAPAPALQPKLGVLMFLDIP